ncbi:uncharacterized protein LOC110059006 isoform X1 [Orbicella faveolata]|uniref:uncharacterized protein LOC110059006 isoform X1 n=1 Tax=Orbicella faveolata TaxID=48498 RepID=UPI0009E50788|nr:uncharacterized protein LOC110059006 isoform X1 [Orbicella faveolata]
MDPEEVKVVGKEVIAFKTLPQLARILTNFVFSFVVYGARNLQPKKGDGLCNASVIFGIGKQKYRTEHVRDNDPTWNEETVIKVTKAAALVFTVMDREDVLGSVSLPLAQIPSVAHRRRWMPLTAKNAQAMGDLCIDCWVLSFKKSSSTGEGGKWKPFGLRAGTGTKDRMKRRTSIENASISKRGSRSIENLYTHPELKADGELEKSGSELSPVTSSSSRTSLAPPTLFKPRLAPTLGQVLSSSRAPEITGLSPKSGPSSGGTRITVRGCNLGKSQEDIASINICGCDLLSTLEYHSPAKLVVVTEAWSGSGPVVLETKSGGRGISTLNFTFQDKAAASAGSSADKKSKATKAELLTEITKLREEINDLTGENRSMKNYIDRLMIVLMDKFPEVLENCGSSA